MQGYHYCELLLTEAERAAWCIYLGEPCSQPSLTELPVLLQSLKDAEQRAEVIKKTTDRDVFLLDKSFGQLVLGKVELYCAIIERYPTAKLQVATEHALELVNTAYESAPHIGYMDTLIQISIFRAWVYYLLGDTKAAEIDLDNARYTANQCAMKLRAADERLSRARLFRDKDALTEAKKCIELVRYFRRKKEPSTMFSMR